ncbi:MAG: hypothetical protein AB7N65_18985 [Vicinamibacterales bacterium]
MADVNTFIDTIGQDVSAMVAPKIDALAAQVQSQAATQYGPRISAFAGELVADIIKEQAVTVRDFVTGFIQDLAQRYHPELAGELQTRIVQGGIEITGRGVRLDLKHRETGAPISSLDIPIALTIKVDALGVTLQNTTVSLDVIR